MSEVKVDKISPRAGTDVTLGDSGDTFTIPSGGAITNSGTATGFGVSNASCAVHLSADVTLTRNVRTKVAFNVEDYDPEGWFDSTTNYRFLPDESGVYFIDACLLQGAGAGADNVVMYIYKNGAEVYSNQVYQVGTAIAALHASGILSLNGSSDYVEIYTMATSSSGTLTLDANGWNATNTSECRMSAMRLI
jgi:hypothetical protein